MVQGVDPWHGLELPEVRVVVDIRLEWCFDVHRDVEVLMWGLEFRVWS
jgi:hypothetical protein